jgi:hypothetical protein
LRKSRKRKVVELEYQRGGDRRKNRERDIDKERKIEGMEKERGLECKR